MALTLGPFEDRLSRVAAGQAGWGLSPGSRNSRDPPECRVRKPRARHQVGLAHSQPVPRQGITAGLARASRAVAQGRRTGAMIILDTNVLSALMQVAPDNAVVNWLDCQPAESIWITSVTLFEAHLGIALLARGKRQRALAAAFDQLLTQDLGNRVLDFDTSAALEAAALAATRQKAGHPGDIRDTQIAGIALARRASFATRNVRHFEDLRVPVVNPWKSD